MNADMQSICDYIKEELAFDGEIAADVDLFAEKILDSFSIVSLAMFLQDEFDIELEAEDLSRDNLSSLNSMIALLEAKRAA